MRYYICIIFVVLALVSGCTSEKPATVSMAAPTLTQTNIYVIQPGDGWPSISKKFNLTPEQMWQLNPGVDILHLPYGQKIYVLGPTNM